MTHVSTLQPDWLTHDTCQHIKARLADSPKQFVVINMHHLRITECNTLTDYSNKLQTDILMLTIYASAINPDQAVQRLYYVTTTGRQLWQVGSV